MHKTLVLLFYKMARSRRRMAVQRSKGRDESRPGRHECLRHGAYAAVCSAVILVLLLLGISTLRAADLSGMWTGNGVDAGDGVPGVAQAGVILEIAQNGAEVTGSYAAPGAGGAGGSGAEAGRTAASTADAGTALPPGPACRARGGREACAAEAAAAGSDSSLHPLHGPYSAAIPRRADQSADPGRRSTAGAVPGVWNLLGVPVFGERERGTVRAEPEHAGSPASEGRHRERIDRSRLCG